MHKVHEDDKKTDKNKAEDSARDMNTSLLADAMEEGKERLCGKENANPKTAGYYAKETKIVLLADVIENDMTKFEDNSIQYPVDIVV